MKSDDFFRFYSSVRYNAQEMVWRSTRPVRSTSDRATSCLAAGRSDNINANALAPRHSRSAMRSEFGPAWTYGASAAVSITKSMRHQQIAERFIPLFSLLMHFTDRANIGHVGARMQKRKSPLGRRKAVTHGAGSTDWHGLA